MQRGEWETGAEGWDMGAERERERVPGKQRRWGEDKGNNRQRETSQSEKHLELMQRMDF